jgi:uncharacterized membrane protein (UPF0127 family)
VSEFTRILWDDEGAVLADKLTWARRPFERTRGLLGRPPLRPGEALVIEPGAQVHTIGMGYEIDVVFCDRGWTVLHVVHALPPWRITRWVRGARYAIELPAGAAAQVRRGMRLATRARA